jgi:hypothetical protein
MLGRIGVELRSHVPFTFLGTLVGVALLVAMVSLQVPRSTSESLFWIFHPLHVFFSAIATAGIYGRHGRRRLAPVLAVGYAGAVGIGTLSDSILPFIGEVILDLPHRHAHVGFIEMWWLVNPLAIIGVLIGYIWSTTRVPHAGHVLLSTWASLFHMTMAFGTSIDVTTAALTGVFLFLAVWVPCCTSDIVFPLLFASKGQKAVAGPPPAVRPGTTR